MFLLIVVVVGVAAATWLIWGHYHGRNSPRALASRQIEAAEQLYREAVSYGKTADLDSIRSKAREHLVDSRTLFSELRYDESRVKAILSRNFAGTLVTHELAHMWFGDNVTLRQWNDIFDNEGYASWAEWGYAERTGGRKANDVLNQT